MCLSFAGECVCSLYAEGLYLLSLVSGEVPQLSEPGEFQTPLCHFYATVINTNRASRPPNGQCTHVFVDKLKDMELAKTTAEAKEACRLTR